MDRRGGVAAVLKELNDVIKERWRFNIVKLASTHMTARSDIEPYLERVKTLVSVQETRVAKRARTVPNDEENCQQAKEEIESEGSGTYIAKILRPKPMFISCRGKHMFLLSRSDLCTLLEYHPEKHFAKRWLKVPDLKTFETVDFLPPPLECPPPSARPSRRPAPPRPRPGSPPALLLLFPPRGLRGVAAACTLSANPAPPPRRRPPDG